MSKEILLEAIALEENWPLDEADVHYQNWMNPSLTDESTRRAVLSRIHIGNPESDMVWGGFSQDLDDTNPLSGLNSAEAKAVLGLPEEWYPSGEAVVHLTYRPPEETVRYIPTVADAGWNPYWMPAPANTGFGLTRHLGKPDKTEGRGEVVHDNGTLDWLISPLIPDPVPEPED